MRLRGDDMVSLRIMIVEDDALLAAVLAELLAAKGHAICATETTEAGATAAAARLKPDLMLVDVALAQGDGRYAVAAIEALGPIAHVYITGGGPLCDRLERGAVVLCKPFSERLLTQAMARALEHARPIAAPPAQRPDGAYSEGAHPAPTRAKSILFRLIGVQG